MNELTYSFISPLRAWLRENAILFQESNIKIELPEHTLHSNICVVFTSERFEADFFVWEKGHWHKAMNDIEFVDWRIAKRDLDYEIETVHYEYETIGEMRDVLDILRDRLVQIQSEE